MPSEWIAYFITQLQHLTIRPEMEML